MAVFGSILVNRHIKQLLACDDLQSSVAVSLTQKLIAAGSDAVEKILKAIPTAKSDHQKSLKNICNEIIKNTSMDVFINEMENDQTVIRDGAKDILSESTSINPTALLNKLNDTHVSLSQIIDVVEFQKEHLRPEQVLTQALKLSGNESARLFDMANSLVHKFDVEQFALQPSKVDSPDKKLRVIEFLGLVKNHKSAEIVAQFLDDPNHMVRIAALNGLRVINKKFDVAPLLHKLPDMKDVERKLALPIIVSLVESNLIGRLAPMLSSTDEQLQQVVAQLVVNKANTESFRQLLIGIEKNDEWIQQESLNLLVRTANGELSDVVRPLLKDDYEFIVKSATKFIDESLETGSFQDLTHAAFHDDWQIRDKAIKLLGESKNKDSLKLLAKVFKEKTESAIPVLKAVDNLKFSKGLEIAVRGLSYHEVAVQRESLKTIQSLVNERHAQAIQNVILKSIPSLHRVVRDTVEEVLLHLSSQFNIKPLPTNLKTMLLAEELTDEIAEAQELNLAKAASEANEEVPYDTFNLDELKQGVMWADRYYIEKEIGRGAMGRVLLAKDTMIDETIVVKFMHPELTADKDARERFIRELKYARKISHPNVIRIHDFLYQKNVAAISMEYFESAGLDDVVKSGKIFTQEEGIHVLSQIAVGMQVAHDENVIHRDLKPSNILIDKKGKVKIVDFGIASATAELDANLTKTGTIIGTPAYLSPERAKGFDADHRADIYALGVISYFMFTGNLPYKGEPMSLLFQHIEGKAEDIRVHNKTLTPKLSFLVKKMMAVNVEDRYQSMSDVKLAIDKAFS